MLSSLPLEFEFAIEQLAALGFSHVDLIAEGHRPQSHLEALASTNLIVSCVALGRGLPEGVSLDAVDVETRRDAVAFCQQQINDAAILGATHCYVIPGEDDTPEALLRFADACRSLASYANGRMMQLCVEHFPGKSLPSVSTTLAWLNEHELTNVKLLLDVGHCLISQEPPAKAIEQAGTQLGYVHFDDNDGVSDLHWPLCTGCLTKTDVADVCRALRSIGYDSAVSLELHPENDDPVGALRAGKVMLEERLRVES